MSVDDLLDDVLPEREYAEGGGAHQPVASSDSRSESTGSGPAVGNRAVSGTAPSRSEPERAATDERGEDMVSDAALPPSPRSKNREGTKTNPRGGLPAPPEPYFELDAEGIPLDSPKGKASTQKARRGMARQRERSGRCPMYAPSGTVCKTCGKVHPL